MDGKNGSHYAKFYMATAQAIKSLWPNIRIGGPVRDIACIHYIHVFLSLYTLTHVCR